jgi:hypothetical protein
MGREDSKYNVNWLLTNTPVHTFRQIRRAANILDMSHCQFKSDVNTLGFYDSIGQFSTTGERITPKPSMGRDKWC